MFQHTVNLISKTNKNNNSKSNKLRNFEKFERDIGRMFSMIIVYIDAVVLYSKTILDVH